MSQRAVMAALQGSQDCIEHSVKILRNCFSKESQHNPGSTLVSSAPNLWAVDSVESRARLCAWLPESSRLHALFTNSARLVDSSPEVAALLREFLGGRTFGLVFANRLGKPLNPSNIRNRVIHPLLE